MQLPMGVTRGVTETGLAYVDISHAKASARIYLQGAHITAYQATGLPPMLWLSPEENFQPGKAIRGGIPICWPWFGAHPTDAEAVAHGFARTQVWDIESIGVDELGVSLELALNPEPRVDWPYPVNLRFSVRVSDSLSLTLVTHNSGPKAFALSQALHSYFDVKDIASAVVSGLRDSHYDDQLLGSAGLGLVCEQDRLHITEEVDRIYYPKHRLGLHTPHFNLDVKTDGCGSAVIWNPWVNKSSRLSHFPNDGYLTMLCVESANCGADSIQLGAGDSHALHVEYRQLNTGKN